MRTGQLDRVVQYLHGVARHQEFAGLTDGQLVRRYVGQRDQGAFAELVRRHGRMVLGVCGRLLRNRHDAEDAFQAVFLVLVRKSCLAAVAGAGGELALRGRPACGLGGEKGRCQTPHQRGPGHGSCCSR